MQWMTWGLVIRVAFGGNVGYKKANYNGTGAVCTIYSQPVKRKSALGNSVDVGLKKTKQNY